MSFYFLAVLAALLSEPTGASRAPRFLAPRLKDAELRAGDGSNSKDAELMAGSSSSSSSHDALSLALHRVGAGWLLKFHGPDGQTEVIDFPVQQPLSWRQYFGQQLGTWVSLLLLVLLTYACCYRSQSPKPEPVLTPSANIGSELEKMFHNGHWQCMADSNICICSFLCPALRWADTTSFAGFLTFWAAFAAFQVIALLDLVGNGVLFGIFSAFLLLYFRQQLRGKLGVESGTFGSCLRDFCFVCWCPCCAIAQEARILKEGIENGAFVDETIET